MNATTFGIDLAKHAISLHGVDSHQSNQSPLWVERGRKVDG